MPHVFSSLPAGYYGLEHIFMILGIMTLCRIKSIEQLRSTAPGEWENCPVWTAARKPKPCGKMTVGELPAEDQILKLAHRCKHFIDTIKIIAYRAETALAGIVRKKLNQHHHDESRALIRAICTTEADLHPDPAAQTLTIALHPLATPKSNAALTHLCKELNETETQYPGTNLRMIFQLVSN